MTQIIAAPSVPPFSGKDGENFTKFVKQLNSAIAVGKVDNGVKAGFLALHLTGAASDELDALPEAVQEDYVKAVEGLRRVYENPNKQEKHKLRFADRKLQKDETPQTLLTDLRNIVMLAYPDEPPIDATLVDQAKTDAENARTAKQAILTGGRKIRVKEAFISAMPLQQRERLLHKQQDMGVQALCDMVEKSMTIKEIVYKGAFDTFQNVDVPQTQGQSSSAHEEMTALLANLTKEVAEMRAENTKLKTQTYKPPQQQAQQTSQTRDVQCYGCKGYGHISRNCQNNAQQRPRQQESFREPQRAQQPRTEIECYGCGGKGHIKRNCPSAGRVQQTSQSKN